MKATVWAYIKTKDKTDYRIQIDGIKKGAYTKILDPTFKGWKEVASGFNYKNQTELTVYSRPFISDDEMITWVKAHVPFSAVYSNTRNVIKVLVEDKEVKGDDDKKQKKASSTKGRVGKSKIPTPL